MEKWTLVYFGDQPYILADFDAKGRDVRCWWTQDYNNRFELDYKSSNPDQDLVAVLWWVQEQLVRTSRFTKDQLDIIYG